MVDQAIPVALNDASSSFLKPDRPGAYSVLVPVFLRVTVPADDDLEAETSAVDFVRSMAPLKFGETAVEIRSVISPLADETPLPEG